MPPWRIGAALKLDAEAATPENHGGSEAKGTQPKEGAECLGARMPHKGIDYSGKAWWLAIRG